MAGAQAVAERPPAVRGPAAPLPASTLAAGASALAAVLAGSIVIQVLHAMFGGGLTPECVEAGLVGRAGEPLTGAVGVCHIIEGLRSTPQTILLFVGIVVGAAAIVVGFSTYRRMPTKRQREQAVTGAVLGIQAVALAALVLWFRAGRVPTFARLFLNLEVLRGSFGAFLTGAKNTLLLALGGEAGGIVIGLLLALLILSHRRAVRAPARTYINFFRGTPLIWQLLTGHFLLTLGFGIRLPTTQEAIIVFSLNTGAYAAEVFRAGIQSIERGQMEAARALGMSYLQAMRYAIVPQAVRRVIPPLMNEFVILIKDTALVLVLGLTAGQRDLFTVAGEGFSDTFNATYYMAAAVGYLVVTLPLIRLVNAVENRLRSGLVVAL